MSRKDYNGLRPQSTPMPFGGQIHSLARKPSHAEMQAMLSQQLEIVAREIYVRAAADLLVGGDAWPTAEALQSLATNSRTAAKAYFESMGVQFEEPSPEPEPAKADSGILVPQPPETAS